MKLIANEKRNSFITFCWMVFILVFLQVAFIISGFFSKIDYLVCLLFILSIFVFKKIDLRALIASILTWDILMLGMINYKLNNNIFLCFAIASLVLFFVNCAFVKSFIIEKKHLHFLFYILVSFFVVISLINFLGNADQIIQLLKNTKVYNYSVKTSIIYTNRNTFGFFVALAFAISCYLFIERKKYIYLLSSIILCVNVALSFSRASMLFLSIFALGYVFIYWINKNSIKDIAKQVSAFLISFLIFYIQIKYCDKTSAGILDINAKSSILSAAVFSIPKILTIYCILFLFFVGNDFIRKKRLCFYLFISFIIITFIYVNFIYKFSFFSRNFIRENYSIAGRDEIWRILFNEIHRNILFGFGPGSIEFMATDHSSFHNIYIEQLSWGGVAYLIFNILVVAFLIKRIFMIKKHDRNYFAFSLALLFAYLVRGFFESNMFFAMGGVSNTMSLIIFALPFAYYRGLEHVRK